MVKLGILQNILLAYPQPTYPPPAPQYQQQPPPQPTYPPPPPQPTYPPPPPQAPPPPPPQVPPAVAAPPRRSKGPMLMTVTGIALLIVGLILMVLMWPIVAVPAMGVYDSPDDLPEEAVEGKTYSIRGTIDQAHTEGDYTIMVIEFKDGKTGWITEGSFEEGESVLFNIKCEDKDDWEDAEVGGEDDDDDDDTDWDEWFESGKDLEEEDLEDAVESIEESMEESGFKAEVTKPPMIGGIIGLVLLIVGIILMILGIVTGSKVKRAAAPPPPPPQAPPPQQPTYPPPQRQQW